MTKNKQREDLKNLLMMVVALLLSLSVSLAHAEQRPQADTAASFFANGGGITFTDGGAALLPAVVLQGMANGELNPEMVFFLLSDLITSCAKDALLKYVPHQRHGIAIARAIFGIGICQIFSCFKQAVMFGFATASAGKEEAETTDEADQKTALAMFQSLSKEAGCRPNSKSPGVDPNVGKALNTNNNK